VYLGANSDDADLTGNPIHDHDAPAYYTTGITIRGRAAMPVANEVYGNYRGIEIGDPAPDANNQVLRNFVHDNQHQGIRAGRGTTVTENVLRGHLGTDSGAFGAGALVLYEEAVARNNVLFDNHFAIRIEFGGTAEQNRVYNNSIGIWSAAWNATILANVVYSNSIGIQAKPYGSFAPDPRIENNLVYDNSNFGVLLENTSHASVVNNTIYQAVGDALRIQGQSMEVQIDNNIFWVESGANLYVDDDSQTGFAGVEGVYVVHHHCHRS